MVASLEAEVRTLTAREVSGALPVRVSSHVATTAATGRASLGGLAEV